jgi:RNA polymerase sigma-70 factor (ECF subfamily)
MSEEKASRTMPGDENREDPGDLSRRNSLPRASNLGDEASSEAVAEMVAGCRLDDRDAQRRLYESFHRGIYRLMVRMVGIDAAPDMTQQVFLRVFRAIDKYSGRGRFDRWLYRVAVNEALQHLRHKRRRQHGSLAYEPMDDSVRGEEKTERKELMELALARLDPELRSICLLREIDELSYREIAEILQIPEGTVGSRLNRARRELREHLIRLGWEP